MGVAVTRTDAVSGSCRLLFRIEGDSPVDTDVEVDAVNFVSDSNDVKIVMSGICDDGGAKVKAKLSLDKAQLARALQRWLTFEAGLPRNDRGGSSES